MEAAADQHRQPLGRLRAAGRRGVAEQPRAVGRQEGRVASGRQPQAEPGQGIDVAASRGPRQPVDGLAVATLRVELFSEPDLRLRIAGQGPGLDVPRLHPAGLHKEKGAGLAARPLTHTAI